VLVTAGIFIFVRTTSDVNTAIFVQSLGVVLAGVIALIVMVRCWPVSLIIPSKEIIYKTWKDGWNVFVTLLSAALVYNTNIFILGMLTNNQTVGYYAVAEKIVRVFHSLVSPVSTAIYPHVSKLFSESKENAVAFLHRIINIGGTVFVSFSLILVVFSGLFVRLFTGSQSTHIQVLIIILSPLPISIFMDNIYGQQVLINIGCSKEFMKAILFPGLISFALSFIFVPILKDYATAIIFLISELGILTAMIYFTRKKGIYLVKQGLY
jgi:PST family polysaccharide transporter